jgi:hypothetical protein
VLYEALFQTGEVFGYHQLTRIGFNIAGGDKRRVACAEIGHQKSGQQAVR